MSRADRIEESRDTNRGEEMRETNRGEERTDTDGDKRGGRQTWESRAEIET